MKVGDLVRWRRWYGLIVKKDEWSTLVMWHEDGEVEAIENYEGSLSGCWEIVSESR